MQLPKIDEVVPLGDASNLVLGFSSEDMIILGVDFYDVDEADHFRERIGQSADFSQTLRMDGDPCQASTRAASRLLNELQLRSDPPTHCSFVYRARVDKVERSDTQHTLSR
jgi:hypothetical protein